MSIPTHNLYDFVHQTTKKQFFLIYFNKWGSRDLLDICYHQTSTEFLNGPNGIKLADRNYNNIIAQENFDYNWSYRLQPILFCHDQEPLNFDYYLDGQPVVEYYCKQVLHPIFLSPTPYQTNFNLRLCNLESLQKNWIILHSELNSPQLKLYESTGQYVGAYWWSHAVIARDWYRFAEYDVSLEYQQPTTLFLMYCRATTGSREYRQTFLDQVNLLELDCCTQSSEPVGSDASAIYNVADINSTAISVVLETIFDQRIHLTEKTLRALATGHPFILAAGPGSLAEIRKYGFKTFDGYINESYDSVSNSGERLTAIVQEMQRIQNLPKDQQQQLITECRNIAAFNRQHFFSKEFLHQVITELQENVAAAYQKCQGSDLDFWYKSYKWRMKNQPEYLEKYKDYNDLILSKITRDD